MKAITRAVVRGLTAIRHSAGKHEIRRWAWLAAGALALCGCVHDRQAWQPAASWQDMCYDRMHAHALVLAAPEALDCGFASRAGGAGATRAVRTCAKAALAAGRPFVAGYQAIGTDSGYCQTVASLPDGQWALLDVDYDRTGGWHAGNGPVVAVQACAGVSMPWGAQAPFVVRECASSESLRARLFD